VAAVVAAWLIPIGLLGLAAFSVRLNGDVQYVIGGLSVAADHGWADTFVHRPLVYRGLLAGLDVIAGAVADPIDRPIAYETVVRGIASIGAIAAGVLLGLGLRRRLDARVAAAVGTAAAGALVLAPGWDFLQPEWIATVFCLAAVGAALVPRRDATAAAIAGLLIVLAAGVKLTTAALVPAALIAIWMLDARRARAVLVGTIVWGAALALVTAAHPTEGAWILDMAALNVGVGAGPPAAVIDGSIGLIEKAVVAPVLVVAPAAAVMLVRLARDGCRRSLGTAIVTVGILGLAPMVIQATGMPYHAAALPSASSSLVAGAGAWWWTRTGRPPWLLVTGIAAAAVVSTTVLALPTDARVEWAAPMRIGFAAAAVALAVRAAREPTGPTADARRPAPVAVLIGLAGILAFVPAVAPSSSWTVASPPLSRTNASWSEASLQRRDEMRALSEAIGRDTPVLYIAFGDIAYHMRNPTDCRYPSPLFLQRATRLTFVSDLWSYRDNRRCLETTEAERVVVQPGWAAAGRLTRDLFTGLRRFDCARPVSMAGIRSCPRRDGPAIGP
jgi:hypothetical protein